MESVRKDLEPGGKAGGFTLMELLLVLGILGLLAGIAVPGTAGIRRWLSDRETRFLFAEWESACRLYRLEHGSWPEELLAGEERLNNLEGNWREQLYPYLERPLEDRTIEDGQGNTDIRIILDSDGDHWIPQSAFTGLAEAERPERLWARVVLYSLTPDGTLAYQSWKND